MAYKTRAQTGKSGARRLLRMIIWFLGGIVVPLLVLFTLAPRSERAWTVSFHVVAFFRRIVDFPGFARHRNWRCSLMDAWSLAVPGERILAARRAEAENRLIRKEGRFDLMSTPIGLFWIPARDRSVLAEMLIEQERQVYDLENRGMKSGDIVLDCGANVGVYTRHALDRGAGLVVAIEPAPEALECLRRNFVKELHEGRVVVYPKGVWDKDGELVLSVDSRLASTADSVALDRGSKGPKVLLTTIDELVEELKLERVDFIKMDIEGAEKEALRGAVRTVAKFRPRMAIALEHRPSDPDDIPALIKRLWPAYSVECGPCVNVNGSLQPDVLLAY